MSSTISTTTTTKIGVVRLGYVGLPLVHAFAQHFDVVGFDVNKEKVALMKQGIDTLEVLRAAGTKWNFLKFFPGLVGGHCIGVGTYGCGIYRGFISLWPGGFV